MSKPCDQSTPRTMSFYKWMLYAEAKMVALCRVLGLLFIAMLLLFEDHKVGTCKFFGAAKYVGQHVNVLL